MPSYKVTYRKFNGKESHRASMTLEEASVSDAMDLADQIIDNGEVLCVERVCDSDANFRSRSAPNLVTIE